MSIPANKKQVANLYDGLNPTLQKYLEHFPKLVKPDLPFEVVIAYLFQRLERSHRRALHGGITKKHSADAEMTSGVIESAYLTRDEFDALFERVFDSSIPASAKSLRKEAEKIRDKSLHGRDVDDPPLRKAIHDVLKYLTEFNAHVLAVGGFEPCGDMRGITGATEKLTKPTTKLVLKGLNLPVS